jgi:hydrogenase expression/formation protein HypD
MRFVDEFRDAGLARRLAGRIAAEVVPGRRYHFMEFCGGHTHAISRYGVADLLPDSVTMVHGPGCPVCVLPVGRIDNAIALAVERDVILCTYADTLRVPASRRASLQKAKAAGADVRMVYSTRDALRIARDNPAREVVFFAIGFETTAPATALAIAEAERHALVNFSVFCNHVLTPEAIAHLLEAARAPGFRGALLDGIVGPAHVSCVIGSAPYERVAAAYEKPVVIAGFEPLDVMQAVLMLLRQANAGRHVVENEYTRAVTRDGNARAIAAIDAVFERRATFEWRGLGEVPHSALQIRPRYRRFDAEDRYAIVYRPVPDPRACECGAILLGAKRPRDCRLFGSACTPDSPVGACMVSSEGACAAWYAYGRFRREAAAA